MNFRDKATVLRWGWYLPAIAGFTVAACELSPTNPIGLGDPSVVVSTSPRVEVDDSLSLSATDPNGITLIGWQAIERVTGSIVGGDSTAFSSAVTSASEIYGFNFFHFTSFPKVLAIKAFVVDANGKRTEVQGEGAGSSPRISARLASAAAAQQFPDTITVVDGVTRALPGGGRVVDAIFNRNRNEFYLTNVILNRLEVFDVATEDFIADIPVGSRPWGIALWPNDTLGNSADVVVVANSGGTNMSIVDVATRVEVRRHVLPNMIVQSVQTEIDPAINAVKLRIEEYDFSDRPQNLGVYCRPLGSINVPIAGATACAPDSVYVAYSTTPTKGQTEPFNVGPRGTVRWENLSPCPADLARPWEGGACTPVDIDADGRADINRPHSHYIWEHAAKPPSPDTDSLQILVDRGAGNPIDTVLSVAKGVTVFLDDIAFRDTTFVRNSGNATRNIVGEGGNILLARAVSHNGVDSVIRTIDVSTIGPTMVIVTGPTDIDIGVSPGIRVRDEISNVASPVRSVAINFNGLTNIVRADSVYILDKDLKLGGTIQVGGPNPGMDLFFDHAFEPVLPTSPSNTKNQRIVFLAREDSNLDVFDTFRYETVTTIPIRDPVIGPLRVARLSPTEQIMIGVTSAGVVVVRIPTIRRH
jgi:YVTN family beta-propeller protein